jgi:hypothetical protein
MGGALDVLGTVASIAMGTNPIMAFGSTLASNVLSNAFAGGGGGTSTANTGGGSTPQYADPNYNYGANTYTLNKKPYDVSKYFIKGDKGVYNLLPMLNNAYAEQKYNPSRNPNEANNAVNTPQLTSSYSAYKSIYDKMAGDAAAQAALAKTYGPQSFTYAPPAVGTHDNGTGKGNYFADNTGNGTGNPYVNNAYGKYNPYGGNEAYSKYMTSLGHDTPSYIQQDIWNPLQAQLYASGVLKQPGGMYNQYGQFNANHENNQGLNSLRNSSGLNLNNSLNVNTGQMGGTGGTSAYQYSPIQYVNWGFAPNSTLSQFANYANRSKNPFFVPFAPAKPAVPTTPTTPPVGTPTNPGNYQPVNVRTGGIIGLLRN